MIIKNIAKLWVDIMAGSGDGNGVDIRWSDACKTLFRLCSTTYHYVFLNASGGAPSLRLVSNSWAPAMIACTRYGMESNRRGEPFTAEGAVDGQRLVKVGTSRGKFRLLGAGESGILFAGVNVNTVADGGNMLIQVAGDAIVKVEDSTAVNPGDLLVPSSSQAGRVVVAPAGAVNYVGIALEDVTAGTDKSVGMLIMPGYRPS